MRIFEETEKNDYFENSEVVEKPKEEKKEVLSPEDPRYWEEPEDEFEHLRPLTRTSWKIWAWVAVAVVSLLVLCWIWTRIFHPYVQEATQFGYVETIEKRGELFPTYEGVLLPYKNLMDTTRVYEEDVVFSTNNPGVAARMKELQFVNKPVRVQYMKYHTVMPWRGESKLIITDVDSVSALDIMPYERQPEFVKNDNSN